MKISKTVIVVIFTLLSIYSYAQTLDVITYNIRLNTASDGENAWPLRKDYLTAQIQFYEPDIFGVQEATPVQVEEITSILTQYNVVGIGRDGEGLGESSNIYFKKDRFILKETNTFWLSETPNEISMGWDAACKRVCTYALLKDKLSKKQLWVFNTHLDHIGEVARTKGLQLILEKIKKVNIKNFPVLLMGDFNSEPTSERIIELNKVMDDSKNVSEQKSFGPLGTFNGFKHNEPVTKLIDYIFISKNSNFRVLKHAILSDSKDLKYPSDHLPVYVKLIYK